MQGMLCIHIVCINRKASLALLRKMMHYITPVLLDEMCSLEGANVNFGSQLVEVLSIVLDNEVRFEVTYTVFSYSFDALNWLDDGKGFFLYKKYECAMD